MATPRRSRHLAGRNPPGDRPSHPIWLQYAVLYVSDSIGDAEIWLGNHRYWFFIAALLFIALAPALSAQQQPEPKPLRFDFTPFLGYRTIMNFPVDPHVTGTNPRVVLDASPSYGVSFGVRLRAEEDLVEIMPRTVLFLALEFLQAFWIDPHTFDLTVRSKSLATRPFPYLYIWPVEGRTMEGGGKLCDLIQKLGSSDIVRRVFD